MAVKNAPPITVAVNLLELRITVPAHHDATGGSNSGSAAMKFENRITQETGTH